MIRLEQAYLKGYKEAGVKEKGKLAWEGLKALTTKAPKGVPKSSVADQLGKILMHPSVRAGVPAIAGTKEFAAEKAKGTGTEEATFKALMQAGLWSPDVWRAAAVRPFKKGGVRPAAAGAAAVLGTKVGIPIGLDIAKDIRKTTSSLGVATEELARGARPIREALESATGDISEAAKRIPGISENIEGTTSRLKETAGILGPTSKSIGGAAEAIGSLAEVGEDVLFEVGAIAEQQRELVKAFNQMGGAAESASSFAESLKAAPGKTVDWARQNKRPLLVGLASILGASGLYSIYKYSQNRKRQARILELLEAGVPPEEIEAREELGAL